MTMPKSPANYCDHRNLLPFSSDFSIGLWEGLALNCSHQLEESIEVRVQSGSNLSCPSGGHEDGCVVLVCCFGGVFLGDFAATVNFSRGISWLGSTVVNSRSLLKVAAWLEPT